MNIKNVIMSLGLFLRLLGRYFFGPIWRFLYSLYKNIEQDDCLGFATRIAYSALFSVVPLLIVIITTLGFIGMSNETIGRIINVVLADAPILIRNLIERNIVTIFSKPQHELFSIGLVFTIWGSTNVLSVAILGINKIFKGHNSRPFYHRRLISFLIVLCIGILTGVLYIFNHTITSLLNYYEIENRLGNLIISLNWPISVFTIFVLSTSVYYIAPPIRIPFFMTIPGAIFFTGLWNTLTFSFKYYINKLGDFSAVYGTLTTAVLIMIWFYLAGLFFMVGAEINYLLFLRCSKNKKGNS